MNKKFKKKESKIVHKEWGELEATYWADTFNFGFNVDKQKYDEETKKWKKVSLMVNGHEKQDIRGNIVYVNEDIQFSSSHPSAGITNKMDDHSWSFYHVFKDTPPYIKERLAQLLKKGIIITDDQKQKEQNPQHFQEVLKNRKLKTENKTIKAENEELKAKLRALEGKK